MTYPRRATEILLLTAVVLLGLWFAAVRPAHEEAGRLDAELSAARQQTAQASARVTALREAREQAPEHRRALRRLAVALPASGGVADLVRELDGAGDRSRVRLEAVGLAAGDAVAPGTAQLPPGAAAEGPPPPGVPFALAFRGRYFDLTDLVRRVHASVRPAPDGVRARGRLVTVAAVTLTLDEEAGGGVVEADLDAVAHVAPEVTG